jgi:hypothetical protein
MFFRMQNMAAYNLGQVLKSLLNPLYLNLCDEGEEVC